MLVFESGGGLWLLWRRHFACRVETLLDPCRYPNTSVGMSADAAGESARSTTAVLNPMPAEVLARVLKLKEEITARFDMLTG